MGPEALSLEVPVRTVAFTLSEIRNHCGIYNREITGQRIFGMVLLPFGAKMHR